IFKEAPLVLGSFTSATDPVIQDVVGRLAAVTGGAPTAEGGKGALAFLEALDNLMRPNNASEKNNRRVIDRPLQPRLKVGRDVLRSRSGTCVNTAIFFASVAEAAGLEPFIVVMSGHAFAGVQLPRSRTHVCVETVATTAHKLPFMQACQLGEQKFAE